MNRPQNFHADNHYVPRVYLKNFSSEQGKVWVYRTLVSHSNVPIWRKQSLEGLTKRQHLYTRITAQGETDEIEKWLDREFEAPAAGVLAKVRQQERLTREDWYHLVRFLAAQDTRTPVRLKESMSYWHKHMPAVLQDVMADLERSIEYAQRNKMNLKFASRPGLEDLPFKFTPHFNEGEEFGTVQVEVTLGRLFWLSQLKRLLTYTLDVLHNHQWTIWIAPQGIYWPTSDNPVIKLNGYKADHYDFRGGWGRKGGEILLPLSPTHLLYTQVGSRPKERYQEMPMDLAQKVRRMIVEHAHHMVIASSQDPEIPNLRSRVVDQNAFKAEMELWNKWHDEQSVVESELIAHRKNSSHYVNPITGFEPSNLQFS